MCVQMWAKRHIQVRANVCTNVSQNTHIVGCAYVNSMWATHTGVIRHLYVARIWPHVCTYVCTYVARMATCMQICMYICTKEHTCMWLTCAHRNACMYTPMYATCMQICTHMQCLDALCYARMHTHLYVSTGMWEGIAGVYIFAYMLHIWVCTYVHTCGHMWATYRCVLCVVYICIYMCMWAYMSHTYGSHIPTCSYVGVYICAYGVATISRLLEIIGLFCRI